MEAYKASETLTIMLKKLKYNQTNGVSNPFSFPNGVNGSENPRAYGSRVEEKPEHSAAMTLGMLSHGGMTTSSAAIFNGGFPSMPSSNLTMGESASGLTANYSMEQSANGTAASTAPFSFLGNGNPMLEVPPANLDWVSVTPYVCGPARWQNN
jgi:hypothetical protein